MKEQILTLLKKRWVLPTATGIVGFGAGALIGYRRTKTQYDKIEAKLTEIENNQELDFAVAEFAQRNLQAAAETQHLSRQVKTLTAKFDSISIHPEPDGRSYVVSEETQQELIQKAANNPSRLLIPVPEPVVNNVFTNDGDEWDYKTELEKRDKADPYVIHVDEFVADEMGWDSQSTLTWYEKDQILTDSHDKPVYNHAELVGELRFGHGSNDANVVYIRNERLQCEYEVLRDEGSYEEIVLGEQMEHQTQAEELRHSRQLRFTSLRSD